MTRRLLAATAVAVGAAVTASPVGADDSRVVPLGRFQPTDGGFAAGPTPGQAGPVAAIGDADPADTERVTWGYRRYYRPYYGGFSYYRAPSYYNFYRPGFSYSYYSAPRFYAPRSYYYSSFAYPSYGFGYSSYYGYGGYGGFCPISLQDKVGTAAAVVDLALRAKQLAARTSEPYPAYQYPQQVPSQPLPAPQSADPRPAAPGGNFRYDGGPSNPVPMPAPDAGPDAAAPAPQARPAVDDDGTLQISLPARPAKKYQFRAYGE